MDSKSRPSQAYAVHAIIRASELVTKK